MSSKSGLTGGVVRGSVFRIIVSNIYYVFSVCSQTVGIVLYNISLMK